MDEGKSEYQDYFFELAKQNKEEEIGRTLTEEEVDQVKDRLKEAAETLPQQEDFDRVVEWFNGVDEKEITYGWKPETDLVLSFVGSNLMQGIGNALGVRRESLTAQKQLFVVGLIKEYNNVVRWVAMNEEKILEDIGGRK
tara:strand:+ start:3456 stop:3875 length:420 start_codon:yes stop_codon:yes gene_type:complete